MILMTRPKTYRVGVIGATNRGNYGHGLDVAWTKVPECQIVAVADADSAGRADAAKRLGASKAFADYRKMLDEAKPDIVAVAPRWLDQRRDMVLAAVERGIHVFTEKPFCRTLKDADAIVAACEKHKVKLAIAHQTRYSPKLPAVRKMIENGDIGQVLELRGRGKEDARGGAEDLWVLGSHVMNLIRYFGGEPHWCMAQVQEQGQPITKTHFKEGNEGLGPLAGDSISAMYGLENGVLGYFGSKRNANGNRFGLMIHGSKGIIEVLTGHMPSIQFLPDPAWSPGRTKKAWIPVSSAGPGKPEPIKDQGLDGGNVLIVQDLLQAIERDRLPECNVYEGRSTIEMIIAVFQSHLQAAQVSIPLNDRG